MRRCFFGEHMVDPDAPDTHFMVTAWVSGPKRDGATLRENTDNLACGKCVAARKIGQDPSQGDLFEEVKPRPSYDNRSKLYKEGWTAGFMNWGYDSQYGRMPDYLAGYGLGQQFKDYLDGYFFFEETS